MTYNNGLELTAGTVAAGPLSFIVRRPRIHKMQPNQWKSLLIFIFLVLAVLCCWSAIDIFTFNHYEKKFGGPWDNFFLSLLFSLSIAVVTAAGYLAALFLLKNIFQNLTLIRQLGVAVVSGVAVLVLTFSGSIASIGEQIAKYIFDGGISLLVIIFLAVSAGVGSINIFLASIIKNNPPNRAFKSDV